jgi:hypothetical protein
MQRYSQQVGFLLELRWSEMMDLGAYKMLREMSFPLWESVRWRFFYVMLVANRSASRSE